MSKRNRAGLALLFIGVAMAARTAAVDSSENIYIGLQVAMWISLFAGFKLFTEVDE